MVTVKKKQPARRKWAFVYLAEILSGFGFAMGMGSAPGVSGARGEVGLRGWG